MCQYGVFDAFRHGMCCFPPAGAAPTENESQLQNFDGGIRITRFDGGIRIIRFLGRKRIIRF